MAGIIAALLALLGPLLTDLLKKWLDGLLNKAAKTADVEDDATDVEKAVALLQEARDKTPRTRSGRRLLLGRMARMVRERDSLAKLRADEKAELQDFVAVAKKD